MNNQQRPKGKRFLAGGYLNAPKFDASQFDKTANPLSDIALAKAYVSAKFDDALHGISVTRPTGIDGDDVVTGMQIESAPAIPYRNWQSRDDKKLKKMLQWKFPSVYRNDRVPLREKPIAGTAALWYDVGVAYLVGPQPETARSIAERLGITERSVEGIIRRIGESFEEWNLFFTTR